MLQYARTLMIVAIAAIGISGCSNDVQPRDERIVDILEANVSEGSISIRGVWPGGALSQSELTTLSEHYPNGVSVDLRSPEQSDWPWDISVLVAFDQVERVHYLIRTDSATAIGNGHWNNSSRPIRKWNKRESLDERYTAASMDGWFNHYDRLSLLPRTSEQCQRLLDHFAFVWDLEFDQWPGTHVSEASAPSFTSLERLLKFCPGRIELGVSSQPQEAHGTTTLQADKVVAHLMRAGVDQARLSVLPNPTELATLSDFQRMMQSRSGTTITIRYYRHQREH